MLARVDFESGNVDWKVETVTERSVAEYGMACSPILWGEAVIVTTGSRQATVSAFDQKSGKQLWSDGRNETAGYSSPAILKVGGKEQLVVFAGASAFAVDSKGKRLWQYRYATNYDCNAYPTIALSFRFNGYHQCRASHNAWASRLTAQRGMNYSTFRQTIPIWYTAHLQHFVKHLKSKTDSAANLASKYQRVRASEAPAAMQHLPCCVRPDCAASPPIPHS